MKSTLFTVVIMNEKSDKVSCKLTDVPAAITIAKQLAKECVSNESCVVIKDKFGFIIQRFYPEN